MVLKEKEAANTRIIPSIFVSLWVSVFSIFRYKLIKCLEISRHQIQNFPIDLNMEDDNY